MNGNDPSGLARCGNCTSIENQTYEDAEAKARQAIGSARTALAAYKQDPESAEGQRSRQHLTMHSAFRLLTPVRCLSSLAS